LSRVRVIPFLSPKAIMLLEKPDMHMEEQRMMNKITNKFVERVETIVVIFTN